MGNPTLNEYEKGKVFEQRRSKLMPREDGPFQIIKRINDSVYKVDLSGDYGVSAIFNILIFFYLM